MQVAYYSDLSYASRAVMLAYLWMYLLLHIWRSDRFSSLAFSRLSRFELKSVVTFMMLTFIPVQLYYDIAISCVLYTEGSKPVEMWSTYDKGFVQSIDYVLMIGFSFQTGTLFLLQSFWNYLAGSVTKHCFMSSLEFKFYILWTLCTILMFPLLKFSFSYTPVFAAFISELAYGISLFILACLGVLSHFRFKKLINTIMEDSNGSLTSTKLAYFAQINDFMTLTLFITSISFITLAADAVSTQQVIDLSKAATDILIFNASFCSVILWYFVIRIVHCPYQMNVSNNFSKMARPSTIFSMSGNYSSTINLEASEHSSIGLGLNPTLSRSPSRNFALTPMTIVEHDQTSLPTPPISPVQRATNPRHAVVNPNPLQRPVSYRHFQEGRVEDPRRPISLYQYPPASGRKSRQYEITAPLI